MTSLVPGSGAENGGNFEILGDALRSACVELMAEYGLKARVDGGDAGRPGFEPPTSALTAAVDFKGDELRGTVELCAMRSVIFETSRGAPGLYGGASNLNDWTCELTNQLMGRMKNKLRAYKVPLQVGVPRAKYASEPPKSEEGLRCRFACDCGTFSGYLDVLIAPGFSFGLPETDSQLPKEGDLVLF
jgi:hypothetical protein